MSINKQLYIGICGISYLFGVLCLILIFFASSKLFYSYNLRLKSIFNEMDTNIVSLNAENADLFGQLLYEQGKFESFIVRNYYNNLFNEFGKELVGILNIEESEINEHFILSTDYSESEFEIHSCQEENSKCFFVIGTENISDNTKKLLFLLIPTLDISLDIRAYNKDNFLIFNKFNFYEDNKYIIYKYNKEDINLSFNKKIKSTEYINNTFTLFHNQIEVIENLNGIKINELTNYQLFRQNTFVISPSYTHKLLIYPLYRNREQFFQFASFNFNNDIVQDNEKVDLSKIVLENIHNYLSFSMKINYLSFFILNFIQRNGGVFVVIIGDELNYTASQSICNVVNYTEYTYSDISINSNLNYTVELLGIEGFQISNIDQCFKNQKLLNIIGNDTDLNYKLKILTNIYNYSYDKDVNNDIYVKIVRQFSPNKYIKSFLNLKFLSSSSVYFLVIKIYNNIIIINYLIDRITYRYIAYIILTSFLLWQIIYIYVFIRLCYVADRISSPIRKLIRNISLSQGNFNNDGLNLEKIYYKEDKDINDLFQLCQRLIIGGFKKKANSKKQNKLNVYNNISKVKTNNMIINENYIALQRNQKYNKIFEKGNESAVEGDEFKNDIFHHYKNNELEIKMKNYENAKNKILSVEKKEEFENLKTKNNEYKMFYYINKEIEGFLPYNNLYKFYYDEFSKKVNKKKKK